MNKRNNFLIKYFVFAFFLALSSPIFAQKPKHDKLTASEIETYKQRVSQLISFLEYCFNTVGSDSVSIDEKETIINESYLKVFVNDKVQIEDDLVEERKVITNKNVKSYLQDIDYFFKDVAFEFSIENITENFNDKNRLFFIVTLTRHLKGTTTGGVSVVTHSPRYVEINLDPKQHDLKIVSIYTNKVSEEEELNKWWQSTSTQWKAIFKKVNGINTDTITIGLLKRLISTEELNLSGDQSITTLDPLNKLIKLKKLNLSNTGIANLFPIRNLSRLEYLNLNNTRINDLSILKYASELKELTIDSTDISSLDVVRYFSNLESISINKTLISKLEPLFGLLNLKKLSASSTEIDSLYPIKEALGLEYLDISNSKIADLSPIAGMTKLKYLDISKTAISEINTLSGLKALEVLNFSNTKIVSLAPLKDISSLKKVYCDNSKVSKEESVQFMGDHKDVLVICGSEELMTWWNNLSYGWKKVFSSYLNVKDTPTKDQLAAITNLETIDLNNNETIENLIPLRSLKKLKNLYINKTRIKDLSPLRNVESLELLEFTETAISSIDPLWNLKNLKKINCNNTNVDSSQIKRYQTNHPRTVVIFRSAKLSSWWTGLSSEWKSALIKHTVLDPSPSELQLHQLISLDSLNIQEYITDLNPLSEFTALKTLVLKNTLISDISKLKTKNSLKNLTISTSPVIDITALESLSNLENISIENTPVKKIEALKNSVHLKTIDLAGTKVCSLKPLAGLKMIKSINCSNTKVGNLSYLKELPNLTSLICFNTAISKGKISKFRELHKNCKVVYF